MLVQVNELWCPLKREAEVACPHSTCTICRLVIAKGHMATAHSHSIRPTNPTPRLRVSAHTHAPAGEHTCGHVQHGCHFVHEAPPQAVSDHQHVLAVLPQQLRALRHGEPLKLVRPRRLQLHAAHIAAPLRRRREHRHQRVRAQLRRREPIAGVRSAWAAGATGVVVGHGLDTVSMECGGGWL